MKYTFSFLLLLFGFLPAMGQYCGLEEPVALTPQDSFIFEIDIEGFLNDNLASPDQGVCGVELFFVHNTVKALEFFLESPDGTRIQLIGPAANPDPSLLTVWDISFVPDAVVAMPDSPFVARWDNAQPADPGSGFTYVGSYYPYQGSLEDFNSGPVNGTWKLILKDPDANEIPGRLFDFRLVMCDETGQDCCYAKAGQLTGPDLSFCQADPALDLSLEPYYRTKGPDTSKYDYTYAIANFGLLVDFQDDPDLRGLPPGQYTICGLSYQKGERGNFPATDGFWTMDGLRGNLEGLMPLFCGELTDAGACITVNITSESPLTEVYPEICVGETYIVGDSTFTVSGDYLVSLSNQAGCDSLVAVSLAVFPHVEDTLRQTICRGESVRVGTRLYEKPGYYLEFLQTRIGCDSVVHLYLDVIEPVFDTLDRTICFGESVTVGNSTFNREGTYQVVLPSAANCDSIVTVNLRVLNPVAAISGDTELNCYNPEVLLDGSISSGNGLLSYEWFSAGAILPEKTAQLRVSSAGTYGLRISQEESGQTCADTSYLGITADFASPIADAGADQTLNCYNPEGVLGTTNTSTGSNMVYEWTSPEVSNIQDNFDRLFTVNQAGTFVLQVQNTQNGCLAKDTVEVAIDTIRPLAEAGESQTLTCGIKRVELDGTGSDLGSQYRYNWTSSNNASILDAATLAASTDQPGWYQLSVTNNTNGCVGTDQVEVLIDTLVPVYDFAADYWLNCRQRSVVLDAGFVSAGPDYSFRWLTDGRITSGSNTLTPEADLPGNYLLELTYISNSCRDTLAFTLKDTINAITAGIAPVNPITCNVPVQTLDPSPSTYNGDIVYLWTASNGAFSGTLEQSSLPVTEAGTYTLTVIDTFTFCEAGASIEVLKDTMTPEFFISRPEVLNCGVPEIELQALIVASEPLVSYNWSGPCIKGDSNINNIKVTCEGTYELSLRNEGNGCVTARTVSVESDTILPIAEAGVAEAITCARPLVSLDGSASTAGDSIAYTWSNGNTVLGLTVKIETNAGGWYWLEVLNENNRCRAVDSVRVDIDVQKPVSDAGADQVLNCKTSEVRVGGEGSSTGPDIVYRWISAEGQLNGATDLAFTQIDTPGIYGLIVEDKDNGCTDTSFAHVIGDFSVPRAEAGPDQIITCSERTPTLDGSLSDQGAFLEYFWDGPCILDKGGSQQVKVDCAGLYLLTVLNADNGCIASDTVMVTRDTAVPLALLPDTLSISCQSGDLLLDASASRGDTFSWYKDGVPLALNSLQPVVNEQGLYTLVMTNTALNCSDTASVTVLENCVPVLKLDSVPASVTCDNPLVTLVASVTPSDANYTFQWTGGQANCFSGPSDQLTVAVACGGVYRLIASNPVFGYADTLEVTVAEDKAPPRVQLETPDTLTCTVTSVLLDARKSETGATITYLWTSLSGDTLARTMMASASSPGGYTFEAFNSRNGCTSIDLVQVAENKELPQFSFNTEDKPCYRDTFALSVNVVGVEEHYTYQWEGSGIISPINAVEIQANQIGDYFVSVTNQDNGCFTRDSINIRESDCAPCLTAIEPDTLTCARASVLLSASLCYPCVDCTYEWTTADGLIIDGGQSLQATANQPGTYRLIARSANGLQTVLDYKVVTDFASPAVDAGPGKLLSCTFKETELGSSLNPTDGRYTYQWQDSEGVILSNAVRLTGVNKPGQYYLKALNLQNGCRAMDSVRVNIDTIRPQAVLASPETLTCNRSIVNLDGTASSFSSRIEYTWVRGTDTLPATTPVLLAEMPETYTLLVRDQANGCFDQATVVLVEDLEKPLLASLLPDTLTCADTSVVLTASALNGGASFQWCVTNPDGNVQDCLPGSAREVQAPGSYRVEAVLDRTGCIHTAEVAIAEDKIAPEISAIEPGLLTCERNVVVLEPPVAIANNAPLAVTWSNEAMEILANAEALAVTQPGAYHLEVENLDNSCKTATILTVGSDTRLPQLDAGRDTFINCIQTAVALSPEILIFAGGSGTTQWIFEGDTLGLSIANADKGGRYYLLAKDAVNGCTQLDSLEVTAFQTPPQAVVDAPDGTSLTCELESLLLDANASLPTAIVYQWYNIENNIPVLVGGKPQLEVSTASTYTLVVTDQTNGCQDTLVREIMADRMIPSIKLEAPLPLTCERVTTLIDASSSDSGSEFDFSWTGPQGILATSDPILNNVDRPGVYSLFLTNTRNACVDSASVSVAIDTVPPQVAINNTDYLDCIQREVWLLAETDAPGNYAYQWQSADGLILGSTDSIFLRSAAAGTYQVTVKNLINGCSGSTATRVLERSTPIDSAVVSAVFPDCRNERNGSISIGEVSGGEGPFVYALNNRLFVGVPEFKNLKSGEYEVFVQGANGCEWSTSIVLPGSDRVTVELGPDREILRGDTVSIVPEITGLEASRIIWNSSEPDFSSTAASIRVSPPTSETYFVRVETTEGCSADDFVTVYVQDRSFVYVPNAFSPNGDGHNDYLEMYFLPEVKEVKTFRIFDRWGNLVFFRNAIAPSDPLLNWDGTFNGQAISSQVYVYSLTIVLQDGTERTLEGSFTLIR